MRVILLLILLFCGVHVKAVEWSEVRVVGLFKNAAAIEVKGKQHILRVGRASPEGVELIAVNGQVALLLIDGQQRELSLGRVIGKGFQKPEVVSETVAINTRGQYLSTGSINGKSVRMLIDTGATSVAMNTVQARMLGVNFAAGQVGSSSTAGGIVKSYSVVLKSVKLGAIEVKQVRAAVLEGIYPSTVLLGMTFLNHVELSEKEGIMTLTKKY